MLRLVRIHPIVVLQMLLSLRPVAFCMSSFSDLDDGCSCVQYFIHTAAGYSRF
jgi:hypothetical protein